MPPEIRKGSAAAYVYNLLIGKADMNTNIVRHTPSSDKREANKFYNGYAMLKHNNILLRVAECTYMFNPFFVTTLGNSEDVKKEWVTQARNNKI